jgi:glycosyltransferase involved in cell wall biosynthesis
VDVDDLETIYQLQRVRAQRLFPPRLLALCELAKLYAYERTLPRRFWRLVVCKEEDRRFFGRDRDRVFVVPNGTVAPGAVRSDRERDGEVVFVGTLGYEANADAAIYFRSRVLPLLAGAYPGARFVVIGLNPPPEVQALHDGQACIVVGSVPDVTPHYETASVVAVPIRKGGGTRLKVLEALAHGKAVVSTSLGAEGLDLRPGVDLEIADDAGSFATACARLLKDAALRRRLGQSGRERIISRSGWDRVSAAAERAISH